MDKDIIFLKCFFNAVKDVTTSDQLIKITSITTKNYIIERTKE